MKKAIVVLTMILLVAVVAAGTFQLGVRHAIYDSKLSQYGDTVTIKLDGELYKHYVRPAIERAIVSVKGDEVYIDLDGEVYVHTIEGGE